MDLMNKINDAVNVYYNKPEDWDLLVKNAITKDVSWQKSASVYTTMYKELLD